MVPARLLIIGQLLLLSVLTACSEQPENQLPPPNIVWITSEDNSVHYMKLFDEHGVETPNIEALAEHGLTFTRAFSNAAVCSAARSTLIAGSYGPRLMTHYHRNIKEVPMPDELEMFPAYLRQAGYYTTNNSKEDYNLVKSDSVWDDSSKKASWRNRKEGQAFFHVFNIGVTHESRLHFPETAVQDEPTTNDPGGMFVQPNHPQTELFRYTNARYRDRIQDMDNIAGKVIADLKADSLMENTFIFYFGDHGGVLPGSKGYLFETGLHVPLVVYVPDAYASLVPLDTGSRTDGFVSFVDFAATVLNLAGVDIPAAMDGTPFLGANITKNELESRDETYSYADRFDEKYDMVRALRKGKYKYIRNYQPQLFDGLMNNYRYKQAAYREWATLFGEQQLDSIQQAFFMEKPLEALFDVEADPFETQNLANNPDYQSVLADMRTRLVDWQKSMPDLSFYPEYYLLQNAADNPVAFGQAHKNELEGYIELANLALQPFAEVKDRLQADLASDDDWTRYWALNTCIAFGKKALPLLDVIRQQATTDAVLLNRVRAAEFMALTQSGEAAPIVTNALYNCTDAVEALAILNSIVALQDGPAKLSFSIDKNKMKEVVRSEGQVSRRIEYLLP